MGYEWGLCRAPNGYEMMLKGSFKVNACAFQTLVHFYPLRKADATYEFPLRCGFLNETYSPITDETAVSVASEVSIADLQEQGLWPLIQLVVRTVLAEGAQFTKDVYLAGTGLGGSHAALVSMWLKTPGEICWKTCWYILAGLF